MCDGKGCSYMTRFIVIFDFYHIDSIECFSVSLSESDDVQFI